MCGIAGIIGNSDHPINKEVLKDMTSCLRHRGPDDMEFYMNVSESTHVGFGHRKLNIIDLSVNANQPIVMKIELSGLHLTVKFIIIKK